MYPNIFNETRCSSPTKCWTSVSEEISEQKKPKSFKTVVRNLILSQRLGKSIDAKIKGDSLKKCNLPPDVEKNVSTKKLRCYYVWPVYYWIDMEPSKV